MSRKRFWRAQAWHSVLAFIGFVVAGLPVTAQPKVIGGQPAPTRDFYAGIGLVGADNLLCGGTFIAERFVLTAAHCVHDLSTRLTVRAHIAGNDIPPQSSAVDVIAVFEHPNFDPEILNEDIAVLWLADNAASVFGTVNVIPMNKDPEIPEANPAQLLTAIGIGNTSSYGNFYDLILREVALPLVPVSLCQQGVGALYRGVVDANICAGDFARGGFDTCSGDSGGPLIAAAAGGMPVLIGLTSFGEGCAQAKQPGVYTRISSYAAWVEEIQAKVSSWPANPAPPDVETQMSGHCYDGFAGAQTFTDANNVLVQSERFTMSTDFAAVDTVPDLKVVRSCVFTVGAESFNADIRVDSSIPEGYRLFVRQANGTNAWEATAKRRSTLNFNCPQQTLSAKIAIEGGYGVLQLNAAFFTIQTTKLTSADPSSTHRQCTVGGMSLDTAVPVVVSSTIPLFLTVTGPLVGDTKFFQAQSEAGQESLGVGLAVSLATPKSGQALLQNLTQIDMFTWKLVCDFPYVLTNASGVFTAALDSQRGYRVDMLYPRDVAAKLPAGQALMFGITSSVEINAAHVCRLNELPLQFSASLR